MTVAAKNLGTEAERFKDPGFRPQTGRHYRTGFKELDDFLNGGFTIGFHGLCGGPSHGKTTFAQQLAENLSESGVHVLEFLTESEAETMAASSISRASYKLGHETAVCTEGVLKEVGSMDPEDLPPELFSAINQSVSICRNITVIDCGSWDHTVEEIEEFVIDYKKSHDEELFVIVDYLQEIMGAAGKSYEDRKALVDHVVTTLKLLSQNLQIPILLICAINRDFYGTKVNLEALKDTGRLEYNLDTILAVETMGVEASSDRKVNLAILKQRTGLSGVRTQLVYHAKFNYFEGKIPRKIKGLDDVNGIREDDFSLHFTRTH